MALTVAVYRAVRAERRGSAEPRRTIQSEFRALRARQAHPHPQPREVREFWGDALGVYRNVFLVYCLLALALMLAGVHSLWLQVPLPLLAVLGATSGYMSARAATGRGFAWKLRPTNRAYLAGLLGGVIMTLLLLAGTTR